MVLENATAEADGFAENAPTSDLDPYSSSAPSTSSFDNPSSISATKYQIDSRNFPQPFPILGRLYGFTPEFNAKIFSARLGVAAKAAERAPTPEEAQLIAHYTAKEVATISYGAPLGAVFGLWRSYSTRNTYRFPFYSPNLETFPKDAFPSTKAALLKGVHARLAWQFLRGGIFGYLGFVLGTMVMTSYATSVRIVGETSDPRLQALRKDMLEGMRKRKGDIPNRPREIGAVDGIKEQDVSALWKDYTQGNAAEVGGDAKEAMDKAVVANKTRGAWARSSRNQTQAKQSDDTSTPFFGGVVDDASPTGGLGMMTSEDSPQPATTGSAWDRVRMQSNTQNKTKPSSWTSRQSAGNAEEHAYRSEDVDRQLARDEAQKDFNMKLERERRGENFSGGAGEGRRW